MTFYEHETKPQLIKNSQSLLWAIRSYENQLRSDGVYSVFCLQAMLDRRIPQKKLSPLEKKFRETIEGNNYSGSDTIPDLLGHFWDDYLASRIDSVVTSDGGTFIDVNQQIVSLDSTQEFYMDYCHMTPLGNKTVADLLTRKVQDFLNRK